METPVNTNNYPSVTQILSETMSPEAQNALEQWKRNVGPDQAEKIRQESMERGRRYDKFVEAHYRGEPIPHNSLASHLNFYECHSAEQNVVSDEFKYRGRYDIIFKRNGMLILNDFKGSAKPKKKEYLNDYPLQIAAYAKALIENGTPIDYGMITMILDRDIQKFVFSMNDLDCFFQQFLIRRQQYLYTHGI